MVELGNDTVDGGNRAVDIGSRTVDSGNRMVDSGNRARLVHARLVATLDTDTSGLISYDLTVADADSLATAIADYEKVISSPQAAITNRKSITKVLRPRFREMSQLLGGMDKIVLRFRKTDAGRAFADAWFAARIVRDLGAGPSTPQPPSPV